MDDHNSFVVEETITKFRKCPNCGGRVEMHIAREHNQKRRDTWVVEHCKSCSYWWSGRKNV